jgi:hypothetical protein
MRWRMRCAACCADRGWPKRCAAADTRRPPVLVGARCAGDGPCTSERGCCGHEPLRPGRAHGHAALPRHRSLRSQPGAALVPQLSARRAADPARPAGPSPSLPGTPPRRSIAGRLARSRWSSSGKSRRAAPARRQPLPQPVLPHALPVPACATVLTVYDVIPLRHPEFTARRARLLFRLTTAAGAAQRGAVLAISEAARQDFMAEFRVPAGGSRHSPGRGPGLPPPAGKRARKCAAEVRTCRTASCSTWAATSRTRTCSAGAGLARRLGQTVAAQSRRSGARGTRSVSGKRRRSPSRGALPNLQSSMDRLGRGPEADLPALYARRPRSSFPACSRGSACPWWRQWRAARLLICSRVTALPEVAGDATMLVDPTDTSKRFAAHWSASSDTRLRRAAARAAGWRRAARFTWERTAAETLEHLQAGSSVKISTSTRITRPSWAASRTTSNSWPRDRPTRAPGDGAGDKSGRAEDGHCGGRRRAGDSSRPPCDRRLHAPQRGAARTARAQPARRGPPALPVPGR